MNIPRQGSASSRFWRWRARSTKSASESEFREAYSSTPSSAHGIITPSPSTPMSPYLTESAHVLSLQNPGACSPTSRMSEFQLASPISSLEEEEDVKYTKMPQESAASGPVVLGVASHSTTMKGLYRKTVRGIESRVRSRVQARKEVSITMHIHHRYPLAGDGFKGMVTDLNATETTY